MARPWMSVDALWLVRQNCRRAGSRWSPALDGVEGITHEKEQAQESGDYAQHRDSVTVPEQLQFCHLLSHLGASRQCGNCLAPGDKDTGFVSEENSWRRHGPPLRVNLQKSPWVAEEPR